MASKTPSGPDTSMLTMLNQAAAAVQGNAEREPQAEPSDGTAPPEYSVRVDDESTEDAPPAYGAQLGSITDENRQLGVDTKASLTNDGRVDININQHSARLTSLLAPALRNQLDLQDNVPPPPPYIPASLGGEPGQLPPPPLNVAIHVVGSRGDVQPFIALGKVLKEHYGHRVRLATHPVFQDFVKENGLEFFSIGGDPAELMAFMVKNPGLMPGFDTLRSGDVGKRRKEIAEMVKGCWRSCIEHGDGTGSEASDDQVESWMNDERGGRGIAHGNPSPADRPFVADAIIANPPSFAHVHCAEKLGCPLHVMFTMPYSPTQAFPHPLANIQSSNADTNLTNFMSYALVDMMTWQGLGDVMNRFRQRSLGLEPISLMWAPGMLARLRIPHTYCWSPALIPKPKDWGNHISISGFYFLSLASNYSPPPELKEFLEAGPPPIYIGFGSIVVDDPTAMTKMIFDAVKKTGQRALVSKGWGGVGADELGIPEGVLMLGNVPHDWLFKHVSCVVHHGGAGTTAAGIAAGRPTVIVPFFGDQPFWGAMVAKAGAGPEPIAYKNLDSDKLAASIMTALKPESLDRAKDLSASISSEDGTESGAQSFHQFLELDKMRCVLSPTRAAVWRVKRTNVTLSALAATVLGNEGVLDFKDLKLYRPREYETEDGPWDPITGGATAIVGTMSSMMMGFADFPVEALKAMKIHPDTAKKSADKKKKADKKSGLSETSSNNSGQETPKTSTEGPMSSEPSLHSTNPSQISLTSDTTEPDTELSETPSQFNLSESLARIRTPTSPGGSGASAMSLAMRDQLNETFITRSTSRSSRPSSRSGSPHGRSESQQRSSSQRRSGSPIPLDAALSTGKGVSRIIGAGFKSPMDFTHSIAKGFHNAPKLYGDDTVRKNEPITDFKSGLRAATKEFGFGFYDGITGLVTQPVDGAKKEGAAGFFKGFAKGIGGIVLKPGAAIFAIPGYTMKGVYKELQAQLGSSVQNYIIAARTTQGYADWHDSTPDERSEIIARWAQISSAMKKKKNPDEIIHDWAMERRAKRLAWQAEHKRKLSETFRNHSESMSSNIKARGEAIRSSSNSILRRQTTPMQPPATSPLHHSSTDPLSTTNTNDEGADRDEQASLRHAATYPSSMSAEDKEIERAIRLSVEQTSKGDSEQDALVERAIRASLAELQAGTRRRQPDEENDEELETAIKESMASSSQEVPSGDAAEEEEHVKKALLESQHPALQSAGETLSTEPHDEEELKKALEESSKMHQGQQAQKTEEEIIMDYVKRQSLLEEEHRQKMLSTKGKGKEQLEVAGNQGEGEDDEELEKAMKLSMQRAGQEGEGSSAA